MKTKKLINSINSQIERLTNIIEGDIASLEHNFDEEEKLKIQKCLVDNLYKITNTLLQLKKLEKTEEGVDDFVSKSDEIILAEYLKRIQ